MMTFQVRLKMARKPNQPRLRFDLEKLRNPDVACAFQATIGGKFAPLIGLSDEDMDMDTNEEVRRKIQATNGQYDELLTLVKKRKLRWFGHVSRSSGIAKTILQGTVKGKRKRGRQKKRWEDNIKEWTGMDFASSTRAAENRSRKGLLQIHLWCPDDLPRLWDRIE